MSTLRLADVSLSNDYSHRSIARWIVSVGDGPESLISRPPVAHALETCVSKRLRKKSVVDQRRIPASVLVLSSSRVSQVTRRLWDSLQATRLVTCLGLFFLFFSFFNGSRGHLAHEEFQNRPQLIPCLLVFELLVHCGARHNI